VDEALVEAELWETHGLGLRAQRRIWGMNEK
jgi:hypothetical protein